MVSCSRRDSRTYAIHRPCILPRNDGQCTFTEYDFSTYSSFISTTLLSAHSPSRASGSTATQNRRTRIQPLEEDERPPTRASFPNLPLPRTRAQSSLRLTRSSAVKTARKTHQRPSRPLPRLLDTYQSDDGPVREHLLARNVLDAKPARHDPPDGPVQNARRRDRDAHEAVPARNAYEHARQQELMTRARRWRREWRHTGSRVAAGCRPCRSRGVEKARRALGKARIRIREARVVS